MATFNPTHATGSITPRFAKILDYAMQGLTSGQIAQRLNMSGPFVSSLMNSPQFQHQLALRRGSYEEKLDESILRKEEEAVSVLRLSAKDAAERMVSLLESDSESIQFKSAADILDRVGPSKQSGANQAGSAVIVINEVDARIIQDTLSSSPDLSAPFNASPFNASSDSDSDSDSGAELSLFDSLEDS